MNTLSLYMSFRPIERVIILLYLFITYHKQKFIQTRKTWYIQLFLSEYYKVYIERVLLDLEKIFKYFRELYIPQSKPIFLIIVSTYHQLCQIYADIELHASPKTTQLFLEKCLEETIGFADECNFDLLASEQPELALIDEQIIHKSYMIFSNTNILFNETNELLINKLKFLLPKVWSFLSKCTEQQDFTLVELFKKKPDFCELYFKNEEKTR